MTPLAAQAADTRAQPGDDVDDTDTTTVEPGTVTVTRTEVAVVPVEVEVRENADIGRIEGRHRLHIESDAFSWRRFTAWHKDENTAATRTGRSTDALNILGGAPVFGVPGSGPAGNVTFGYGYGVSDRVVVGARLGVGWQQFTEPDKADAANRAVAYNVTPYVEIVFRPDHRVRPFLGARVGLGGSSLTNIMGETTRRISTIGPLFGVSAGLHAFISERVTFDAALAFDYALAFGRTKVKGNGMGQQMDQQKDKFERTTRMPNLALVVGFSVWLGHRRDRDRRDDGRVVARR